YLTRMVGYEVDTGLEFSRVLYRSNVSGANTVNTSLAAGDFTAGVGTLLSNYSLPTTASGGGQITPVTLSYVADAKSRCYGVANPAFTGTATGFVNSETIVSATTGILTFSSAATTSS